eukprot:358344_1
MDWFLLVVIAYVMRFTQSLQNVRIPPDQNVDADSFSCRLEGGPPGRYPVTSTYYSEYNVPPLPSSIGNCYYIYVDYHMNIDSTYNDNQFVPQLMLGNVLCNSTNSGDYKPSWCKLTEWHIQSQYYFQTNNTQKSHA